MKRVNIFNSEKITGKHSIFGFCSTICQQVLLAILSVSILSACNPSTTNNNNYGADKAGMSGGGATKDPGDGTGGSTGDGGGGQGVRCGVTKNPSLQNKLFVRDIYESIYNQKRTMKVILNDVAGSNSVSPEAIKVLTDSLKEHFGPASSNIEFTNERFWTDFAQKISFLDEDKQLLPSQDANSAIVLPSGCKIVQIAYWDESPGQSEEGTLFVNKQLWTELTQINKIGLLAHEYFFKQARKALYKNSDSVRNKVGGLLSTEGIKPLFKSWVPAADQLSSATLPKSRTGYKFCSGTSSEDPSAKLLLYQYEGSDKKQHVVIPLLTSSSINSSFLKTADFTFDPNTLPVLAAASDLMIYQTMLKSDEQDSTYQLDENLDEHRRLWYPRWFENRNFIDSEVKTLDFYSLDKYLLLFGKIKEIVWSDFLNSSPRPIKVALLNPAANKLITQDFKLKSREELILTLQRLIGTRLNKCGILWPESDGWIASLKNEVTESINAGKSPTLFPKWVEQLSKIDSSKCEPDNENLYSHQAPAMLYSLMINAYNRNNVIALLDRGAFDVPELNVLNPGQIRITQDLSVINFKLDCDDYESAYFKLSDKKDSAESLLKPNKKVSVPQFNGKTHRDGNIDILIAQSIGRLAKYLSFKGVNPDKEQMEKLTQDSLDYNCLSSFSFMNQSCDHLKRFTAELSQETDLSISQCPSEHTIWKEDPKRKETHEVCAIVKMGTSNHSYKIYFSFPLDSDTAGPHLGFVRFLGLEKTED